MQAYFYFCCVAYAADTGFNGLSVGFHYFTNFVQLQCSLSGWLHLNCSSIGTGFNGAETNCRIAHNLGILLMNSNCFAICFSGIITMSIQISIYRVLWYFWYWLIWKKFANVSNIRYLDHLLHCVIKCVVFQTLY